MKLLAVWDLHTSIAIAHLTVVCLLLFSRRFMVNLNMLVGVFLEPRWTCVAADWRFWRSGGNIDILVDVLKSDSTVWSSQAGAVGSGFLVRICQPRTRPFVRTEYTALFYAGVLQQGSQMRVISRSSKPRVLVSSEYSPQHRQWAVPRFSPRSDRRNISVKSECWSIAVGSAGVCRYP